jgi:anti-sigma factor RsiW
MNEVLGVEVLAFLRSCQALSGHAASFDELSTSGILRTDLPSPLPGTVSESARNALSKGSGKSLPRLFARRKIPAAAFGLKKNLLGTVTSSTSGNDENTPPPLGHSEVSAVQNSVGEVMKPELGQRLENDSEITASVG